MLFLNHIIIGKLLFFFSHNHVNFFQNLYSIEADSDSELKTTLLHRYYLPKSKQRFLVSACLWSDEAGDRFIVCADKTGTLHLYNTASQVNTVCDKLFTKHCTHELDIPTIHLHVVIIKFFQTYSVMNA